MKEDDTVLKVFQVTKRYKDPALDMLKYFGDSYGEIYEGTEIIVAQSASGAIDAVWLRMELKMEQAKDKPSKWSIMRVPVEKEKWRAWELTIPGYVITVKKVD